MRIKNEESRSGDSNKIEVASVLVNGDATHSQTALTNGNDSGSMDSGDLGNNGGGGDVVVVVVEQEKEFVKEKKLKKPSFVVGCCDL